MRPFLIACVFLAVIVPTASGTQTFESDDAAERLDQLGKLMEIGGTIGTFWDLSAAASHYYVSTSTCRWHRVDSMHWCKVAMKVRRVATIRWFVYNVKMTDTNWWIVNYSERPRRPKWF